MFKLEFLKTVIGAFFREKYLESVDLGAIFFTLLPKYKFDSNF